MKYIYPISDVTISRLRKLDLSDWRIIFHRILNGQSIDYNIEFSDSDALKRIKELYELIIERKISEINFQAGLVSLLQETYVDNLRNDESFVLIKAISDIRPSLFFHELELLLISPEFEQKKTEYASYNYGLAYLLANALTPLDVEKRLWPFLFNQSTNEQPPEYYQVCIRYIYTHLNQENFDSFMNNCAESLSDDKRLNLIISTFEECAMTRKEFTLFYRWLKETTNGFAKVKMHFFNWLENNRTELIKYTYYFPLLAICAGDKLRTTDLPLRTLQELIKIDSNSIFQKENQIKELINAIRPFIEYYHDDSKGIIAIFPSSEVIVSNREQLIIPYSNEMFDSFLTGTKMDFYSE